MDRAPRGVPVIYHSPPPMPITLPRFQSMMKRRSLLPLSFYSYYHSTLFWLFRRVERIDRKQRVKISIFAAARKEACLLPANLFFLLFSCQQTIAGEICMISKESLLLAWSWLLLLLLTVTATSWKRRRNNYSLDYNKIKYCFLFAFSTSLHNFAFCMLNQREKILYSLFSIIFNQTKESKTRRLL